MLIQTKTIGSVAYLGGLMAVPEVFTWSWSQMQEFNSEFLVSPGESIFYNRSTISLHYEARNRLVAHMRGDWLVMLDTDITFDPDLIARLLHRATKDDLDVLTGLYQYKTEPHSPVLYKLNEQEYLEPVGAWKAPDDGQPFFYLNVDAAGGGCLFVRRRVFERIDKELKERPFDQLPGMGEDFSFFARLRKLGIKIVCDPSIQVHHLLVHPLTMADYDMAS